MAVGGWSCPHQAGAECLKVPGYGCVPGMKGCVLVSKYVFASGQGRRTPPKPVKLKDKN